MLPRNHPASIKRGVRPIVTKRRARDAMDAERLETSVAKRTAKACGPGALVAGAKLADDDLLATVTQKPVSPGRARYKPSTPSRRECRCFGFACSDYACVLLSSRTQGCGCSQTPGIPCTLSFSRAAEKHSSGVIAPRECTRLFQWDVIPGCAVSRRPGMTISCLTCKSENSRAPTPARPSRHRRPSCQAHERRWWKRRSPCP